MLTMQPPVARCICAARTLDSQPHPIRLTTRMKLFRKSLLLLTALISVSLFPSCGGSPNDTGDQYVAVSSFKSGSIGFYIQGSPAVRIISNGVPNDLTPGSNPAGTIGRLDTENDGIKNNTETSDEAWSNFAGDMSDVTTGTQSCLVNVSIHNSSTNEYSISGQATYTVADRLGYLELYFDEVSGSNNNLEYAALIHFMGALTRSDLTYSTDGDGTDSSGTGVSAIERVLITSLTGSVIKFWFNFETNQCLTELCYVGVHKFVNTNTGETYQNSASMKGVWRITHPFLRLTR